MLVLFVLLVCLHENNFCQGMKTCSDISQNEGTIFIYFLIFFHGMFFQQKYLIMKNWKETATNTV
jgi:hypothetical protein